MKNKKLLYTIGAVAILTVTVAAVYFSNSTLFSGMLQLPQRITTTNTPPSPGTSSTAIKALPLLQQIKYIGQLPNNDTGGAEQIADHYADILTCTVGSNTTLVLSTNGTISEQCSVTVNASVTTTIFKGTDAQIQDPNYQPVIVKKISQNVQQSSTFSPTWDGKDSYDVQVAPGQYTFVVVAHGSNTHDYSLQTFTVEQSPGSTPCP